MTIRYLPHFNTSHPWHIYNGTVLVGRSDSREHAVRFAAAYATAP